MLSALAVILHHPLTCLVFALWSFVGPWNEGGDEFYHSMLTKFGYGDYHAQEVSKLHAVFEDPKKLLQSASDSLVPTVFGTESLAVETTTQEPAAPPSEHSSSCTGDEEHLGKWRHGSAFLDLHYVCEAVELWPEEGCMPGWAKFQDSCYYAELDQVANFPQAVHACNVRSGAENAGREPGDPGRERRPQYAGLVVCETQAENQFVQKLVGRQSVWIGLTNTGDQSVNIGHGNWTWTDGSTVTYMNWDAEDQPDYHRKNGAELPQAAFMNFWKDVCMPPPWRHRFPVRMEILMGVVVVLTLLFGASCMVMPCVFALVYKSKVTDHRSTIADFRGYATQQTPLAPDFRFPLCGCLSDMHVCCHSWWFMSVRASDTHQAAGTEKFWTVFMWWVFSLVAGHMLGEGNGFIAGLIMAAVMVGKRKALRTRLGIAPGSPFSDFMLWWCCAPCVVAQEAREVDQAAGVAVRCCCSLATVGPPMFPLVGPAVTSAPNALLQPLQPTAVAPQAPLPVVAQVVHIQPPAAGYAMAQIQGIRPPLEQMQQMQGPY